LKLLCCQFPGLDVKGYGLFDIVNIS